MRGGYCVNDERRMKETLGHMHKYLHINPMRLPLFLGIP